ncbi:hypothetical protein [Streptococcus suis]|uniref:hypothetical protein n=1 Tax=Streptococcus suis TaxID=1307 RepID=UPI001CF5ADF9|nr:hypothetical protein [Streptococcus suis]MCQ8268750.1 hypothetical protein [Streptococcus suis]
MEIPSLIFCRRTTGWHTGLRHTRFGRNPRKAAQGKTVRVRADLHHIIKFCIIGIEVKLDAKNL